MSNKPLTHVVGTFLIQAEGAFLNGAGLGAGEDRNVTIPKTFTDFRDHVPYVSAQAWKRWLRNTFQEENPDEPAAELVQTGTSAKGTTSKIGTEMDPIKFPEDDIFGYMRAEKGQGRTAADDDEDDDGDSDAAEGEAAVKEKGKEKVAAVMRPAPFAASILVSLRKSGWEGLDEGFVHLKEGTPLPYSTRFYNTQLQGVFGLNYSRLGVFRNEGDRIELDRPLVDKYLKEGKIQKDPERDLYGTTNNPRKARATKILKALAVLRGGAKLAAFAVDVAPKVIILAGLTCGNLIFNDLFEDTKEGPKLKLDTLKEVIADYKNRIVPPVFVGIRTGYLHTDSESDLRTWAKENETATPKVVLTTPLQAVEKLTESLP
jgi:CRISPR-associated protein Cst2